MRCIPRRSQSQERRTDPEVLRLQKKTPARERALILPRVAATGCTQLRACAPPLPPCGGGPTRPKAERGGGSPGMERLVDKALSRVSRKGPRPDGSLAGCPCG